MSTPQQLLMYGVIGVASNAALYALYLVLTSFGLGHKTAMTLLFVTGMAWTFRLNRRWTFRHRGQLPQSARRYVAAYLIAYVGNVAALAVLVDGARLPHRVVMLVLIVATACSLFALQKFWVFPGEAVANPDSGVRG